MDSVLSLGFISEENVSGYMEALPEYEVCLSKLAELLIGVRLGIPDVPEAAISACIKGMDKVVDGLKSLTARDSESAQEG